MNFKPSRELANYAKTDLVTRRNLFLIGYVMHRRYPFTTIVPIEYCIVQYCAATVAYRTNTQPKEALFLFSFGQQVCMTLLRLIQDLHSRVSFFVC